MSGTSGGQCQAAMMVVSQKEWIEDRELCCCVGGRCCSEFRSAQDVSRRYVPVAWQK